MGDRATANQPAVQAVPGMFIPATPPQPTADNPPQPQPQPPAPAQQTAQQVEVQPPAPPPPESAPQPAPITEPPKPFFEYEGKTFQTQAELNAYLDGITAVAPSVESAPLEDPPQSPPKEVDVDSLTENIEDIFLEPKKFGDDLKGVFKRERQAAREYADQKQNAAENNRVFWNTFHQKYPDVAPYQKHIKLCFTELHSTFDPAKPMEAMEKLAQEVRGMIQEGQRPKGQSEEMVDTNSAFLPPSGQPSTIKPPEPQLVKFADQIRAQRGG